MSDADLLAATSGLALPTDVVQGLIARGIPPHVALGAAAGVGAEAKGDPNAVNPRTGAVGYGQWLGPRKDNLLSAYGGKVPDKEGQIDYLAWELKGGDPGMASVMSAPDPQTAAELYIKNGMRPGKDLPADLARAHQYLASANPQPSSPQGVVPASTQPSAPQNADPFDPGGHPSQAPAASATPAPNDPFDPGAHPGNTAPQGGVHGNGIPDNAAGRVVPGNATGNEGGQAGTQAPGLQPHQVGIVPGAIDAGLTGYTAGLVHPVTAALNTILPLDKLTNPNVKSIWDGSSLGDAFHNNVAIERGANADFRDQHPNISLGSDLAGAIASPFNKLFAPAKGAGLLSSIPNLMLQGATYGGVRGASETGTPEGTATGAGIGEALGPVGGAIGTGIGKIAGALLKGRSTLANAIPQSLKQQITSMIDSGATVDQIHDAIPESKTIANVPKWVQFRASGGKGPITWGDVPSKVEENAPDTKALAAALKAHGAPVDDNAPIVVTGHRRGIDSVSDLPASVAQDAQRLTTMGVNPDEALREADIRYVGAKPTVAAVTRDPQEQIAFNEGAKLDPQLNDAQAANNQALHDTTAGTVEKYGGVPAQGDAAQSAAEVLAKASDAEKAKVDALYKQADEQAASLKQNADNDATARQSQADAKAAQDAQAAARAKLTEAQQTYKASKTDINADSDKALKALQAARENLRTVTANPPLAPAVPSRTAPGYIDLSPVQQALNAPEMANPATDGLRALVNGAKGYISTLSKGTNRVSAQEAESVRQFLNSAYDPMGSGVNNAIGKLKSTLDQAMDTAKDVPQSYKVARAAHKNWAEQYDNPDGVSNLIRRDAKGNFVSSDNWRKAENGAIGTIADKPFIQAVTQLKKIGATDAINKLKASIVQQAYERATNSARDARGNPVFSGKLFHEKLNQIGMPKLKALFEPDEIAHLATIGRAARHLNEPVPGTLNTSNTSAALTQSSLAAALKAKPGKHPVFAALKLGSAAMGHIPAAIAIHGAEHLSTRSAQGAIQQGVREQLNTGLARAMAQRSQSRITNELYRQQVGRALRSRGAVAGSDPDNRRALAKGLQNAL